MAAPTTSNAVEISSIAITTTNGTGNGNGATAAVVASSLIPATELLDPLTGQPIASSSMNGDGKSTGNECTLGGSPTFFEDGPYRFLIIDSPNDKNLPAYLEVLKRKRVVALCRACEPRYSIEPLTAAGITVLDVPFPDGDPPPKACLDPWLDLVEATFAKNTPNKAKEEKVTIAVHCVAGLGRAPALVAAALVERGMEPMDAIAFIRKKRKGAINARQIKWLESYERTRAKGCCTIM